MRGLVWLLGAGLALAQGPAFEVAVVRQASLPSAQELARAIRSGRAGMGIGQQVRGNQVSFGLMTLRDLAAVAYEVKPLQVKGPDWITQQRYDITALMPEGASEAQIPAMLQALLKERFMLVARKSAEEQTVLALEVAKGGHKLKEASPPPEAAPEAEPPAGQQTFNIGGRQIALNGARSADGVNLTLASQGTTQKISMGADGKMHLEADRFTMAQLADMLTPLMEFPVVDKTGLTGAYQVALELSVADLLQAAGRAGRLPSGLNLPQLGGANGLNAADPGGDLTAAIQKLGLRLEKQKGPVETVVIESAERNPSEN